MEISFIIAQVFGLFAFIICIISIAQKTRNRYIVYNLSQNVFSGIQYLFLNKFIAFYLCSLSIVRLLLYKFKSRYNKFFNIFILVLFIILNLIISLWQYSVWYDVFPLISSLLVCYTVWQKNILIIRIGCIISKLMWGIYATITLAYFSILMDIFIIAWTIFVIIKDFKFKKVN